MNKREMANELMLRANRLRAQSGSPAFEAEAAINEAASEALREKAEREEQERPKVTLAEQIAAVQWASGTPDSMGIMIAAAAETLRKLDEEGGKLLRKHANSAFPCTCDGCRLARHLGVEPKP